MKTYLYALFLLLLFGISNVNAQTPQTEVETAVGYLQTRAKADQQYIKFLSAYAVPEPQRNNVVLTASFLLHSLVGPTSSLDENNSGGFRPLAVQVQNEFTKEWSIVPYQLVPGSETLWWIDVRDYNFTPESWEVAANRDGYFVEPIVQSPTMGALRLLSGNAVLRMDWFIVHVTDVTKQIDLDDVNTLYNNFLFAQNTKPKNIDEWRKAFALDIAAARTRGNEYGVLVSKSQQVALHNRMLFGYRTEFGYLYDTYDVKNQEGHRDYVEAFFLNPKVGAPPVVYDASETFASNPLGLQAYALSDGQGNLINFGDPTVVRHLNDVLGDARVRVAHSCFDCHASGPLPSEHTLAEFIKSDGDIYLRKKEDLNRVNRVFLSKRFEDSIEENQLLFKKSLKKTNGLEPDENGRLFLDAVKRYNNPITVKIAAFECGVTEEVFKDKVSKGNAGGRLKILLNTGEPIPRSSWESRGKDGIPGQFQQAMILINGLTKIERVEVIERAVVDPLVEYIVLEDVDLVIGERVIQRLVKDTKVLGKPKDSYWMSVQFGTNGGYVPINKLKLSK